MIMTILKVIGIILFFLFIILLLLVTVGWAITMYALDHGWDKEWIDKEDRENGNH
jgi:hypothetical protein